MCSTKRTGASVSEVLQFTYPKLHTGKNWYIDFFAFDPAENKMKRKKYMLDGVVKITERKKRATEIIEATLKHLRSGWSSWINTENSRSYALLEEIIKKYLDYVERMPKLKTIQAYRSKLNVLKEYIGTLVLPPKYVYQFDTVFVSDFLDWVYIDRECSARTRNNYRIWCSTFSTFLIEKKYLTDNPAEKIKDIAEAPKKRQPLTAMMLRKLNSYLAEHDKCFLLACKMEYYTFIRPEELSCIRLADISINDQTVYVSGDVSKNSRSARVGLNEDIIKLMIDLDVFSYPSTFYLFGPKMKPAESRANGEIFRRKWIKMRPFLKWPDEYQFYSLKDSGIRDLANSAGIVIARDQARHSDVSTTNRYLQGQNQPVHEETKHFTGSL